MGRRLRFNLDGIDVTVRLQERGGRPARAWLFFSPLEARIVRALLGGPATREQLARVLEEPPDGKLKGVLAELVAREVLASGSEGYRLLLGESTPAKVAAW